MISWRRGDGTGGEEDGTGFPGDGENVTHLGEYGHADVAVAGLVDEGGQLVRRYGSGDGFLSGLWRQAHSQVLLVRQQIRAGLRDGAQPIRKRDAKTSLAKGKACFLLVCLVPSRAPPPSSSECRRSS